MSYAKHQITVSEAAKKLGVTYNAILLRIRQRRLPAIKLGGVYIIQAADVAKLRRLSGARAPIRGLQLRLREPKPPATQPPDDASLSWPPGLLLTRRRKVWFDCLAKLEPGLDIATIARRLDKPYFTVWTWVQTFGYRYLDTRRLRGKQKHVWSSEHDPDDETVPTHG